MNKKQLEWTSVELIPTPRFVFGTGIIKTKLSYSSIVLTTELMISSIRGSSSLVVLSAAKWRENKQKSKKIPGAPLAGANF